MITRSIFAATSLAIVAATALPAKAAAELEWIPLAKKGAWKAEAIAGGACAMSYDVSADRAVMFSFRGGYKSMTVHLISTAWNLKPETPQNISFMFGKNGDAFRLGGSSNDAHMISVPTPTIRGVLEPLLKSDSMAIGFPGWDTEKAWVVDTEGLDEVAPSFAACMTAVNDMVWGKKK